MNKRGQDMTLWAVIEPAVVVAFIILIGGVVFFVGNATLLNQAYLAKDSAVIVDALLSLPKGSSVELTYPNRFPQYYFEASNNLVQVSSDQKKSVKKQAYPFTQHGEFVPLNEAFFATDLRFYKEGTDVTFHKRGQTADRRVMVDEVDTSGDIQAKRIFIVADPGTEQVGSLLRSMVNMESRASVQATGETAELVILLAVNAENVLRMTYAGMDVETSRKARKLAQLVNNEFAGQESLFASQEIRQAEGASFVWRVPAVRVEIGSASASSGVYADRLIVALRNYYVT